MRAIFFVIAVIIVGGAAARTVWLRSRTIVLGYEIRKLRDAAADGRADNDMLRAEIATSSTMRAVEAAAKSLKLDLAPMAGTVVKVEKRRAEARSN